MQFIFIRSVGGPVTWSLVAGSIHPYHGDHCHDHDGIIRHTWVAVALEDPSKLARRCRSDPHPGARAFDPEPQPAQERWIGRFTGSCVSPFSMRVLDLFWLSWISIRLRCGSPFQIVPMVQLIISCRRSSQRWPRNKRLLTWSFSDWIWWTFWLLWFLDPLKRFIKRSQQILAMVQPNRLEQVWSGARLMPR